MTKKNEKQAEGQEEKITEDVINSPEDQKENKETEKLQQKVSDLENQVKRVLADYQNLEKRAIEQRKEWIVNANKNLLLQILPVLDTLMLAGKHVQDQGLQLSIQQFLQALQHEGVKRIETLGKEFNPRTMECFETVEGEENIVIEEVRAGYTINDYILRPAQVKVGKEENPKH